MRTIKTYIRDHHIKMDCEEVGENPNMEDFEGYHYKCILRAKGKQLTTFFSMGLADLRWKRFFVGDVLKN